MTKKDKKNAIALLRNPAYLFLVGKQVEDLGVVGEKRNRLILFIAALTATSPSPVSVIVKGASSSGKSNLVRKVLRLLPESRVIQRTTLSGKAPVHGKEDLSGKVLYLTEQRGGKDAQLLLRLLQSEGGISHEFTTVRGTRRSTELARRTGSPSVITTTTADSIFEDDETRFLSIWIDESPQQTQSILKSELLPQKPLHKVQLHAFQAASEILLSTKQQVHLPDWWSYVAEKVPAVTRTRREWPRLLALCKVLAIIRSYSERSQSSHPLVVNLADYAVLYRLMNRSLSRSLADISRPVAETVEAVRIIYSKTHSPVTVRRIAKRLHRTYHTTYPHVRRGISLGHLRFAATNRENNSKPVVPVETEVRSFLPPPTLLVKKFPTLANGTYVDPLTGKPRSVKGPKP